jgi:predicted GNAT superfamily acetyltransferase
VIVYRHLTEYNDLERAVTLEIGIWGLDPRDAVPANLLHAQVTNGGSVIGAFHENDLVGIAFAFPAGRSRPRLLWSHMTGVHPDYQGQRIGFGLKQAQRQWALANGYTAIGWTFDPLQRGNANFNLHQLGATARIYHINFYGEMTDAINAGLPSDRLEVVWKLRDRRVVALAQSAHNPETVHPHNRVFALFAEGISPRQNDFFHISDIPATVCAEIPYALANLKRAAPSLAHEWRLALRQTLIVAFSHGFTAVDFMTSDDRCWYVLKRSPEWFLYLLECSDGTLYTGITPDITRRLQKHNAGSGAAYTAARRPVRLIGAWSFPDRSSALSAESAFKRLSRQQKLRYAHSRAAFSGGSFVDFA